MGAPEQTEVLIIGGGPAGATSALRLMDAGITPIIVERTEFPRFHIGESMTGECGNLVRDLGFEDEMKKAEWPVKHGVMVAGSKGTLDWWIPMMRRNPDLTATHNPTWQVRRATFDKMLLDEARDRGAKVIDAKASEPIVEDGRVKGAVIEKHDGSTFEIRSQMLLDCSGQATWLANRGATGKKYLGSYDKQIAIFSHLHGYVRDKETDDPSEKATNTHIFYTSKYHWAWGIPIDHETQSVGIVTPAETFRSFGESKNDYYVRQLRDLNPGLAGRVSDAELVEDVHVIPNYSFQTRDFAGPGFICVGDAHRFVDPIFSFGLFVAIKEGGMAAAATVAELEKPSPDDGPNPFFDYMRTAEHAIDILEDMIDTFWENPLAFSVMVHDRFREPMIDVFSGRIYEDSLHLRRDEAMESFRRLLKRERTYGDTTDFSIPIGSRFLEERAPLWDSTLDSVETTERWLRDLDPV